MIKIKNKILTALLGAFMVVGGISVVSGNKAVESRATTTSVATLTFPDDNKSDNKAGTYSKTWTAQIGSNTWSISNFNNNSWNSSWTYIKCGNKTAASVATITNTTELSEVSKIVVTVDKASSVNSFYVQCGNSSSSISENKVTLSIEAGENIFDLGSSSYKYFKITFDCAKSSSNGTVQISKIDYQKVSNDTTISSLVLKGTQKNEYYVNDSLESTVKCTATYKDSSGNVTDTIDVDATVSSEGVDMTTSGTKTITASYDGLEVTYQINVSEYSYVGDGSLANPFTITDAIYKAKESGTTATEKAYYIKGTITSNSYYNSTGSYTLTFTEDAGDFLFFKFYADENQTKFSEEATEDIANGKEIIGYGNIFNYNGTKPQISDGYIYLPKVSSIASSNSEVTKSFNVGGKPSISELGITITSTLENGDTEDVTSDATISWSGENENGLVKGDNTLTITYTQTNKYSGKAFASGGTASTTVVVKNVIQPVTSIKIDNEITEINLNEPVTLTATVSPDDANDKTITWSSSDETIATVTDAGVVTGVATGKVTITAKSGDMSDSIELVVKDPNFVISTLILSGERDYFVGEDFDKSFYTATGVYNDDVTELDVTDDVTWDLTNYNKDAAGTYKVSVNYVNSKNESITESVDVNVVEKVLSYIVCDEGDMKTSYTTDDTEVDLTGINVLAVYKDAKRDTKVTENLNVVKQPDFTTIGSHDVTVSYTDNGITKEDTVTISVSLAKMVLKNSNPDKYEKVTADRDDWSGTYVLTYDDKYAFNGLNTSNNYYDVSISNDSITSSSVQTTLTIAKYENGYSIKMNGGDNDGKYISGTADSNALNLNDSALKNTISFVDGNVDIVSNTSHLRVYYAYSSKTGKTTLNFKYYKKSSYASQIAVQLYRLNDEFAVTEDMYNKVLAADKALVCGTSENGWNGTYDIDTVKENIELLSDAELTALKNAEANQDGNIVEKFLWKYDYLISAGKITDNFLNRNVASAAKVSPIFNNINNDTTIAIIVIISLISVSSIAGFLFLKKRKEQ